MAYSEITDANIFLFIYIYIYMYINTNLEFSENRKIIYINKKVYNVLIVCQICSVLNVFLVLVGV